MHQQLTSPSLKHCAVHEALGVHRLTAMMVACTCIPWELLIEIVIQKELAMYWQNGKRIAKPVQNGFLVVKQILPLCKSLRGTPSILNAEPLVAGIFEKLQKL